MTSSATPVFSVDAQVAIEAAVSAGPVILDIYASDFKNYLKEDRQPVTEADTQSDKIIRAVLSKTGYPILSEENFDDKSRIGASKVWIVDPLDGTNDFINKTGEFAILIGLVQNGESITGVIFQPTDQMLFVAERGKGAWKKEKGAWQRLEVGKTKTISASVFAVSRHHLEPAEENFLHNLKPSIVKSKGSAGLKMADIAAARADAYFTFSNKIKQWDICAGHCLINEAGGRVTDWNGKTYVYNSEQPQLSNNGVLVTNDLLLPLLLDSYQQLILNYEKKN